MAVESKQIVTRENSVGEMCSFDCLKNEDLGLGTRFIAGGPEPLDDETNQRVSALKTAETTAKGIKKPSRQLVNKITKKKSEIAVCEELPVSVEIVLNVMGV